MTADVFRTNLTYNFPRSYFANTNSENCPGEPFIKFQLDWKREMEPCGTPFFFGYTWNGGKWPIYMPDIRSAALGGYGADHGPSLIEIGAGERIQARQIENYYRMTEMMRNEYGPSEHRLDGGIIVK